MPESDGAGPRGPVPLGPGAGGRCRSLAGRRACVGVPGAVVGPGGALGQAAPPAGDRRGGRTRRGAAQPRHGHRAASPGQPRPARGQRPRERSHPGGAAGRGGGQGPGATRPGAAAPRRDQLPPGPRDDGLRGAAPDGPPLPTGAAAEVQADPSGGGGRLLQAVPGAARRRRGVRTGAGRRPDPSGRRDPADGLPERGPAPLPRGGRRLHPARLRPSRGAGVPD